MHLKLRNPDAALKDAECAVELDPQYAKAFLRRASAHQALEHFEEAVKDLEKVIKPTLACPGKDEMHQLGQFTDVSACVHHCRLVLFDSLQNAALVAGAVMQTCSFINV